MRRRPGYLRITLSVFRWMSRWAVSREYFPWVALGAPLAAWLLPGGGSLPPFPFAVSAVTWCLPASIMAGWACSGDRKALSGILTGSVAGRTSLVVPEMTLPMLAGSLPAVLLLLAGSGGGDGIPWQVWTVAVFSPLTALSAVVLLEKHLGRSGYLLGLAGFMAQASTASWAGSGVFRILVPQGYPLWTIEWAGGSEGPLHGDVYAFFAVLQAVGLSILAFRILLGEGNREDITPWRPRENPPGGTSV